MGSVGTFIRGNGIKRTETISEGIQCVRYGELYTTYTTSFEKTVSFVNEELANQSKPIQYGDALLTLTGENKQDIGKAVVFLGKERTVIGGDLIQYTNHCFEPLFLSYLLNSPYVVYQKSIASTGDIIVHLSGVKLSNILVALPPIKEQARIVDAIDKYLPLVSKYDIYNISKSKMDSEIYPLLKKSLLQYAIQGKLVPQDPNDEPASVLLERIRTEKEQLIKEGKIKRDKNDSYIYRGSDNSYYLKTSSDNVCIDDEIPFKIPTNWCWCSLSELITYQNGYAFSKTDFSDDASAGIPVIKSNNIMSLTVKINSKTDYVVNPNKKMMSSAIHKGDLLMCLSSQSSNTEPLGKTALYKWDEIALLNQRVLKLTPINVQITEYLYWLINSDYFHYTVSHRSGGSAQSNLKLEHVLTMAIPLPPLHEQQRIVNAINNINILLGC